MFNRFSRRLQCYLLQRMYFNMTVTVNGTNRTDLVLSDSILDNPQLDLYQGIYGWSLFLVLLFTFTNALSYMMVSVHSVQHIK